MRQSAAQGSVKTRKKWENLLREHWVTSREKLAWVQELPEAYAASVINGERRVPHAPLGVVPATTLRTREWPLPSEALTSLRFRGDEWADDPSVACWASAEHPDQEAVRFADHFSAAAGELFLAATDERVSLVTESSHMRKEESEPKKWFRRKKGNHDEGDPETEGKTPVKSFHDSPMTEITRFEGVKLGRTLPRREFIRFVFRDGSNVLLESEYSSLLERDLRQAMRR